MYFGRAACSPWEREAARLEAARVGALEAPHFLDRDAGHGEEGPCHAEGVRERVADRLLPLDDSLGARASVTQNTQETLS